MTKVELAKYLRATLNLEDWRMHARVPGNIIFTRQDQGGTDSLFFYPERGVYSVAFGQTVSGRRTYAPVVDLLTRAGANLVKYLDYSYHVRSRRVTELHFVEIHHPSDFDPWLPTARAMVHEDVLPQLERYRYLGPLHERIAAADLQEIRSFMPSTGIGSQPHIAIIKHLVGAPDAAHYISDLIERLTAAGLNYTEDVERLENIQKVLNNVAPLSPQQIWGNHS